MKDKNEELLASFMNYCNQHPDQRFWQALRNWSGEDFILVASYSGEGEGKFDGNSISDTFYWEKNRKQLRV